MPTNKKLTVIRAHIPVDRVTLVKGPNYSECREIRFRFRERYTTKVETIFRGTTLASVQTFRLKIAMTGVGPFNLGDNEFEFNGLWGAIHVHVFWNPISLTGSITSYAASDD